MKYAIIFDIDGTTANTDHRAHYMESIPRNYDAFYKAMDKDTPIIPMVNFIQATKALSDASHDKIQIIFVTGRPEEYREITTEWLSTHLKTTDFKLYMRETKNHETDISLKTRIFKQLQDKYHILFAIDDRTRLVNSINAKFPFPCIQYQKHDF